MTSTGSIYSSGIIITEGTGQVLYLNTINSPIFKEQDIMDIVTLEISFVLIWLIVFQIIGNLFLNKTTWRRF